MKGLDKLNRKLRAMPKAAVRAAEDAIATGAGEVVALQKNLAPREDGELIASIRDEKIGPTKTLILAGGPLTTKPVRKGQDASYDYALGQEFGTAKMRANPFFYPAWRALRGRSRSRITRAINKAIREEAQRGGSAP